MRALAGAAARGLVAAAAALLLAGCAGAATAGRAGTGSAASAATTVPAPMLTATERSGGVPCPSSDATAAAVPGGLPDVTLPCLDARGGPAHVRLAGLRGHPLVLNLWATWCSYCRAEVPLLASASKSAGARVTFLGLDAEDDGASGRDFAAAAAVPYASVVDSDGVTKASLRWAALPVTVFYTGDGHEAGRHVGPLRDAAELAGLVRRYLGVDLG